MTQTLYERIGGEPAVDAAVDLFYRKLLGDDSISRFFDDIDMDEQRAKQKAFLTMAFGGPGDYTGKDLGTAHERLVNSGLNDDNFDAVAKHLLATLDALGVPIDIANEVMTIAASTRDDVLNRKPPNRSPGLVALRLNGAVYDCRDSETVLEALLRHKVPVSYSCCNGVCLTCMLRSRAGAVPAAAQKGLKDTLRLEGHFLPCIYTPSDDLDLTLPNEAEIYGRAVVRTVERLAPNVCRVILSPATPLYYRAGQFINLRRHDGLVRSYSLASVPRLDDDLELHVKRLPDGEVSNWIFDDLGPDNGLDLQGPNGDCFYVPGRPGTPLLLIGNGSGLAPLIGIARDALHGGHTGTIHLYHGSRHPEGLYLDETLRALASVDANFDYVPCVSGERVPPGYRAGRAEAVAFGEHGDLTGWRVYLCGYPPMVHRARKTAYLAGASFADIHADPFELRDLRTKPRD